MILILDDDGDFTSVTVRYRNKTYTGIVENVECIMKDNVAQNKHGINLMKFPVFEYSFKIKEVRL